MISQTHTHTQDGVASPEDIDTAVSHGLGLRYSFMGPFATMHLNANGIEDYCQRYGANIVTVCNTQLPARELNGSTLDVVKEAMESQVPLNGLEERRQWRESRLGAIARHKLELEKN